MKRGKWPQKLPCQGKHREFRNVAKTQRILHAQFVIVCSIRKFRESKGLMGVSLKHSFELIIASWMAFHNKGSQFLFFSIFFFILL